MVAVARPGVSEAAVYAAGTAAANSRATVAVAARIANEFPATPIGLSFDPVLVMTGGGRPL